MPDGQSKADVQNQINERYNKCREQFVTTGACTALDKVIKSKLTDLDDYIGDVETRAKTGRGEVEDDSKERDNILRTDMVNGLKLKGGRASGWLTVGLLFSIVLALLVYYRWTVGMIRSNDAKIAAVELDFHDRLKDMELADALLVQEIANTLELMKAEGGP